MKCPVDSATLLMSERHNVEIDYCPECRGVWLDRGELDKLLRRADDDDDGDDDDRERRPGREHRDSHAPANKKKRKKGWLSEVFELGG